MKAIGNYLLVLGILVCCAFIIPHAEALIPDERDGVKSIRKAQILAFGGLIAEMENFDFDMKFEVTGFSVTAIIKNFEYTYPSRDSRFTAEQVKLIQNAPSGTKVYFENIKAKGSDGSYRNLNPIVVKLQ